MLVKDQARKSGFSRSCLSFLLAVIVLVLFPAGYYTGYIMAKPNMNTKDMNSPETITTTVTGTPKTSSISSTMTAKSLVTESDYLDDYYDLRKY